MAESYKKIITEHILDRDSFIKAVFSKPYGRSNLQKVIIRPVLLKNRYHLQFSYQDDKKDITKNYKEKDIPVQLKHFLRQTFKAITITTKSQLVNFQVSERNKATVKYQKTENIPEISFEHNRQKNLILAGTDSKEFLYKIGIMTIDGKIKADMQDKYSQINEFLKVISETDGIKDLKRDHLEIVDLGCGNAYLTFGAYHYFNNILKIPTSLMGVDVNEQLLKNHRLTTNDLGWEDLKFTNSKIIDFKPEHTPDIVLALHACDTATDEALFQAISWNSQFIFSAPCCQHELQQQLDKKPRRDQFNLITRHGILKERLGDILTDSFRAALLRIKGYKADVFQFIDSKHTPKNVMIRAVKGVSTDDPKFTKEYQQLKSFWEVNPYLEKLLSN